MYHLPLLPGYGPNTSVRSSVLPKAKNGRSILSALAEAEGVGYQGTLFSTPNPFPEAANSGFFASSTPLDTHQMPPRRQTDVETARDAPDHVGGEQTFLKSEARWPAKPQTPMNKDGDREEDVIGEGEDDVAEVVFFAYGVIVFFGLDEGNERAILDDLEGAGVLRRKIREEDWEVEECHFAVRSFSHDDISLEMTPIRQYDPTIARPRVYNDFFSMPPIVLP